MAFQLKYLVEKSAFRISRLYEGVFVCLWKSHCELSLLELLLPLAPDCFTHSLRLTPNAAEK